MAEQNESTNVDIDGDVAHAQEEQPVGVFKRLGSLPTGALVTEDGLAHLLGKGCRESIKRAVVRGELPQPVKLMGKNTWTARIIIEHIEQRLAAEARRSARRQP